MLSKKQIAKINVMVEHMPLEQLRWAALMYGGEPTKGKLSEQQQLLLKMAHERASKMPNLWQ